MFPTKSNTEIIMETENRYKCLLLSEAEFGMLKKLATVVTAAENCDPNMMPDEPTEEEEAVLFALCERISKEEL